VEDDVEEEVVDELLVVRELVPARVELEDEEREEVVVSRLTLEPVWITITPTMSAITATAPTTPAAINFRPGPPFTLDASAR
jgi:hypothetical protein